MKKNKTVENRDIPKPNESHALRRRIGVCPHCGQSMAEKNLKIKLSPMKRRVLDLIQRRPGITNEQLSLELYGQTGRSYDVCTRVTVSQLRSLLIGTGVKLMGRMYHGYWLEEVYVED